MQLKIRNLCFALLAALPIGAAAQTTVPPFDVDWYSLGGIKPAAGYCPVGVSPTEVRWSLCNFSSVPTPIPVNKGGTYATIPAPAVSNLLSNPAAGNYKVSCADSANCTPTPATAAFVTDPPFDAVCDGTTDDTAAIQACLNSGVAECDLPVSTPATTYQCNADSTLKWPSTGSPSYAGGNLALNGNGSILAYQGTGIALDMAGAQNPPMALIENLQLELDSTSGDPIGIGESASYSNAMIKYLYCVGNTIGAQCISVNNIDDYYLYGIYSNIPMTLGASVQETHIEGTCFDPSQTFITLPATYVDSFSGLSVANCAYAMELAGTGNNQTITLGSADFDGITSAVFKIDHADSAVLNGGIQYHSNDGPLFSNASNFQGNLSAYDFATGSSTYYHGTSLIELQPPVSGNATTEIQNALNGPWPDVQLLPGTFTSDRLSLNRSNVTLHGAGQGITAVQAACPYTLNPQYGDRGGLLYVWPTSGSLTNVHVKDASFIGCDSSSPITSVTLDGTDATITATNTLSIGDQVVMNLITGGATPGLNGGGPFTVISSGLSTSQFKVAYTGSSGGAYAQTTAYFHTSPGDEDSQGIVIDGCNYCSVEKTAVEKMGAESILFAPSITGDYPVADSDLVTGGNTDSISANFAYGAQFKNNTIVDPFGGACLAWSGNATVIQGNVVRGCTNGGIEPGGSGYSGSLGYNAEIYGNIIDDSHICIELTDDGATGTTTKWYDIANNICSNYSAFGFYSTLTQSADQIFIKGFNASSTVNGAGFAMIWDTGAGKYFIQNSTLVGTGTTTGEQYGIYVNSGSPVLNISGNTITNHHGGDVGQAGGATPTMNFGINTLTNGPTEPYNMPQIIFSHAGTQLFACAVAYVGTEATVGDATALTPGTAYSVSAGAGSDTVRVQCALVGSSYAWQTM